MSVADMLSTNDEEFFTKTLAMLEVELGFDVAPASTHDFKAALDSIGISSPTASASSSQEYSSPGSPNNDGAYDRKTLLRVAMKAKRYRNRKREELESLRSTIKTLEVRLAALKARPAGHAASAPLCPRHGVWEAVAMEESEKRQQAGRKNDDLRQALESHIQLVQKLDQVIKKMAGNVNKNGRS